MGPRVSTRVALVAAGACVVFWMCFGHAQTPQEHVHSSAHTVMAFDISKTLHIFRMTEEDGVQRVVIRDISSKVQVPLIQQHLQHEAERFQQGNYSDPGVLHGKDMPGLQQLEASGSKIKVSYAPLPDGAQIVFSTDDRHILTEIHRWFGAQLSEHGADAKAE
ncbi:MAG TPA: hypothetical protein VJS12_14320 [Steroidobacteraceae bacterium]|nr:hypothetical protein [Steroidobacteraceae bacterium]